MRWKKDKSDKWGGFDSWSGRYKNFKIKVSEGGNGFSRTVEYYWFILNSEKMNVTNNSLWQEMKFESLEEAQAAAIKWVDDYIKTL